MTTAETFDAYVRPAPTPASAASALYKGKRIPAYEMIRHSVCLHRGCFGGCSFCTISAHQGKFSSFKKQGINTREVRAVTHMPDFPKAI